MPDLESTALGSDDGRTRLLRRLSVGAPALLMFLAGVWGLGRPSMFGSEAETYWAAQLRPASLFHLLAHVDAVHGTYYLTVHAWLLVDTGPTSMRALSVVAMTGAVAMTSVLAGRLTGSPRVGLVAGVLLALLPSVNGWAQSGRPYALVTFAVTVLVWTLVRALEPPAPSWPRWVAFGAATVVCGYLHEMTLLLVPAFAVTLAAARVPRIAWRRWASTTVVAVVVVVPLLVVSSREAAAVGYLRRPGRAVLAATLHQFFGHSDIVAYVVAAAALIGSVTVLRRTGPRRVDAVLVALPLLVVPASLLFVESRFGKPLFDDRYVLYGAVGAAILAAVGLDRVGTALVTGLRSRPALVAVPAVLVCVLAAALQWPTERMLRSAAGHGEDYRSATGFLAAHSQVGDAVVFTSKVAHSAQLGYPAAFHGLVDVVQSRTAEQAGTFVGRSIADAAVPAAMLAHPRIWSVGPYRSRRISRSSQAVLTVLGADYRPVLVARFAGVDDVLYVRRTRG